MDVTAFEGELAAAGFAETEVEAVPPGTHLATHAHGFDLHALVLEGEITISAGIEAATFRAGQVFTMADGREHQEQVGPEGVRFLVGRRRR